MYKEQLVVRMVHLARQARTQNIPREEIINRTMQEKASLIVRGHIQYVGMCSGNQINPRHYPMMAKLMAKLMPNI